MADSASTAGPPPSIKVAPPKPLTDLEKLELDRIRLEKELKELQKELQDTLDMNDDMLTDLKIKDEFLAKQEAYLKLLSEKNAAELLQLDTEHASTSEKYSHNIEAAERNDMRLRMHRERFLRLENENSELAQALVDISEKMAQDGLDHAHLIHEMNKGMGDFRKSLERKLRIDLQNIEDYYQSQAFVSLSEREKRQMFDNTKLKDEVTLQGVGLANLSLRLGRQKAGTERCNKVQKELNRRAREQRNLLNDLQLTKMGRTNMKAEISAQVQTLLRREEALTSRDGAAGLAEGLLGQIQRLHLALRHEVHQKNMWARREELAHELNLQIQPVSDLEQQGYFAADVFKYDSHVRVSDPSPSRPSSRVATAEFASSSTRSQQGEERRANTSSSSSSSSSNSSSNGGSVEGLKLSVLEEAVRADPLLHQALAPLMGRESICIAEVEQPPPTSAASGKAINLAGWLVYRLLALWTASEEEAAQAEAADGRWQGLGAEAAEGPPLTPGLRWHGSLSSLGSASFGVPVGASLDHLELPEETEAEAEAEPATDFVPQAQSLQEEQKEQPEEVGQGPELFLLRAASKPLAAALDVLLPLPLPLPQEEEHGSSRETEEELEQLWDQAFLDPSATGSGVGAGVWYRRVPLPRRLPSGITGSSAKTERFTFDSIRPAKLSHEMAPPVAIGSAQGKAKAKGKGDGRAASSHSSSSSGSLLGLGRSLSAGVLLVSPKLAAAGASAPFSPLRPGRGEDKQQDRGRDNLLLEPSVMFSSSGTPLQRVKSATVLSPFIANKRKLHR